MCGNILSDWLSCHLVFCLKRTTSNWIYYFIPPIYEYTNIILLGMLLTTFLLKAWYKSEGVGSFGWWFILSVPNYKPEMSTFFHIWSILFLNTTLNKDDVGFFRKVFCLHIKFIWSSSPSSNNFPSSLCSPTLNFPHFQHFHKSHNCLKHQVSKTVMWSSPPSKQLRSPIPDFCRQHHLSLAHMLYPQSL